VLDRFVALGGKILLIGCDHDNVTFLHYAEHIVEIPGKRIAVFEVPVLEHGVRVWKEMKEHDTSERGAHPSRATSAVTRTTASWLSDCASMIAIGSR
jgi:aminoglycoside N3'-acetyltransferase